MVITSAPVPVAQSHGGAVVDLLVGPDRAAELKRQSVTWPSWDLTRRQLCDFELLASGGFSPLRGFLGSDDWAGVCRSMRLADGTLWPVPVTLEVPDELARTLAPGDPLALRDPEGVVLGILHVEEVYEPDLTMEAQAVYGTTSAEHPGVARLLGHSPLQYVGGHLEALQLPVHHDFRALRRTPAELRDRFRTLGWERIVAFQTGEPMHRAHQELTRRAAESLEAGLLLHPLVGMARLEDVDHYSRVRSYRAALDTYRPGTAELSLLPLAPRNAGPREAVWQAIVHRNHGCTHLILDRDQGAAQELLGRHEDELGIEMVPGAVASSFSGEVPCSSPPRAGQGLTVFFTGLSGSGKSTIANAVLTRLLESGDRRVSLLDGDLVRKHLSSELGFSREHRNLNIRRIGFVAAEITKHGGIALCAPIAPYDAVRKEVRSMVEAGGGFVLVHVATPLAECEARDRKGLYAKARAGIIPEFTGISDPYEEPGDADLVIDTTDISVEDAAGMFIDHLRHVGYLPS